MKNFDHNYYIHKVLDTHIWSSPNATKFEIDDTTLASLLESYKKQLATARRFELRSQLDDDNKKLIEKAKIVRNRIIPAEMITWDKFHGEIPKAVFEKFIPGTMPAYLWVFNVETERGVKFDQHFPVVGDWRYTATVENNYLVLVVK